MSIMKLKRMTIINRVKKNENQNCHLVNTKKKTALNS